LTAAGGETPLVAWGSGDHPSKAGRQADVVLRDAGPWSPTVLRLLQHFEAVGFAGAPRVIGDGFAADGRETLSYIEGSSPHPRAWSDDAGPAIGRLLRQAHDASASFDPGLDAIWKPWFGRDLPGSHPVIGHCDTGPWNVVATAGIPTAFIDWEFAGPTDARWELAEATWLNAQLHDDDLAEQLQLPDADSRARQARSIIDGYGLSAAERAGTGRRDDRVRGAQCPGRCRPVRRHRRDPGRYDAQRLSVRLGDRLADPQRVVDVAAAGAARTGDRIPSSRLAGISPHVGSY
jgi:hypothetical protein